jgi:hypothetical protein
VGHSVGPALIGQALGDRNCLPVKVQWLKKSKSALLAWLHFDAAQLLETE